MRSDDETERLIAWLFERTRGPLAGADRRLFAVLDAARSPAIFPALHATELAWRCLFDGALEPALAAAAPYVVELERASPLTRQLVGRGWDDDWGVFAVSRVDLDATRRHLRRFLRVVDEDRRPLLFRYYDPRVLRAYLPTCTRAELEFVFGPVTQYLLPAEEGGDALRCELRAGELVVETADWRA